MPADQYLARLFCLHEINNSPLGATVIGPPEIKRTRYRPTDALLKFLESL